VLIDADGLNNLARIDNWPSLLRVPAILTPHPGEMARLTGLSVEEVQASRLAVARKYAAEWNAVVLLKGAPSIVAEPGGRVRVNPFTNPGMASGGTGDVLAGVIAGFVAQGLEPFDAASTGLYISSHAGEIVRSELGSAGMLASDVAQALPRAMMDLRNEGPRTARAAPASDLLSLLTAPGKSPEDPGRP
jgi:NAD(P)H-hydrate epimerase